LAILRGILYKRIIKLKKISIFTPYSQAINEKVINYFKKINKKLDIYFIMGADNLINFHKWHKWKSISQKCNILVFDRQGYKAKSLKSITFKLLNHKSLKFVKFKKVNISSSQLRKI